MKRHWRAALALLVLLPCSRGSAQEEDALVTYRGLTLGTALALAQATLKACRQAGYQVSVAVVDRSGVAQVMLRDRLAGVHTPETARRKAWTAASFRSDTLSLAEATQPGAPESGTRFIGEALMLGGGVPVEAAGSVVGAVGVSGAPRAAEDQKCAQAGITAIEDRLAF